MLKVDAHMKMPVRCGFFYRGVIVIVFDHDNAWIH